MRKEKEQILIIGLGKFGMSVAKELSKYDAEVLAVDESSELVDEVAKYVTHAAKVNAGDIEALKKLGVTNFDVAIIGIGDNLEASIMIALTLKELNMPYIIAKARDEMHTRLLSMIGVDKVVQPEKDVGIRIAKAIMHKSVIERVEFGKEYSIIEIETPKDWIGASLNGLNVRAKHGINIVCVEKADGKVVIPSADYIIEENDNLMIISPNKELEPNGSLRKNIIKI